MKTRIVTPRLQAAIEEAVQLLDVLTYEEGWPSAEPVRAELLEAFEEASPQLGPAGVERLEKR